MEYITKYLEGGPRVQYPESVIERVQQQWPSQFDSEEYNDLINQKNSMMTSTSTDQTLSCFLTFYQKT